MKISKLTVADDIKDSRMALVEKIMEENKDGLTMLYQLEQREKLYELRKTINEVEPFVIDMELEIGRRIDAEHINFHAYRRFIDAMLLAEDELMEWKRRKERIE